jgi:hypothetical protein
VWTGRFEAGARVEGVRSLSPVSKQELAQHLQVEKDRAELQADRLRKRKARRATAAAHARATRRARSLGQ